MLIERSRRVSLKKNMMERLLAMKSEEKASKRKTTLYRYPCYFLDGAIRALWKCLGVETAIKKQEIKSSHLIKPHSGADLDPVITTPKASTTNIKKSFHEDPSSTTTRGIDNASLVARRGPRNPELSQGMQEKNDVWCGRSISKVKTY